MAIFLVALTINLAPITASAAGLVPCGGAGEDPCQACHVTKLINKVVGWLIVVLSIVASILIAFAGFKLVTSGGNSAAKTAAKETFTNIFIGFVIILGGWLIVDTLMKTVLGSQAYGVWNEIQCVAQPVAMIVQPVGYEDRSRGVASVPGQPSGTLAGTGAFTPAQAAALAALNSPDAKVAEAARAAGLNAEQTRNLQALMRVESGGCRAMTSPAGALGCMQIMPATAANYMRGSSPDQIQSCLRDNDCNIALGTRIYADLNRQFNNDARLVHAAYNGGPGANLPSRDCPGLRRFECQWDNPEQTIPNVGYRETRNYVQRIPQVAAQLPVPQ